MTTIIMLFALPIGIAFYFWDKKNVSDADRIYAAFIKKTLSDTLSTNKEKIERIDHMFYANGFKTTLRTQERLVVEKKHLNLGVPVIMFALLNYFGLFAFIIYYFYFLKPMIKEIDIHEEQQSVTES